MRRSVGGGMIGRTEKRGGGEMEVGRRVGVETVIGGIQLDNVRRGNERMREENRTIGESMIVSGKNLRGERELDTEIRSRGKGTKGKAEIAPIPLVNDGILNLLVEIKERTNIDTIHEKSSRDF